MEPFKLLDSTLQFLYENRYKYSPEDVQHWLEKDNIIESHEDFEEENFLLIESVLHKLCEDKYLYQKETMYNITFLGLCFIKTGGYVQKNINDNAENNRKIKNERRLVTWTVVASIIAGFLLIVETVRLIYEFPEAFDWIWLSCGC